LLVEKSADFIGDFISRVIFLLLFYWRMGLGLYNFLRFMSRGQDQLYVLWYIVINQNISTSTFLFILMF